MKNPALERIRQRRLRVGGRLGACGLAWIALGCAPLTPRVWHWAGPELQAVGVHHAAGGEKNDQLYLDVQHVAGIAPGPYSIDVPSDWQGLPRPLDGDSVPATDPRLPVRLARRTSESMYVSDHLRITGSELPRSPGAWSQYSPNRFYGIQMHLGRARSLSMTSFGFDSVNSRWVRLGSDSLGRASGVPLLRKCAALIATPATIAFDAVDIVALLILWGIHGD